MKLSSSQGHVQQRARAPLRPDEGLQGGRHRQRARQRQTAKAAGLWVFVRIGMGKHNHDEVVTLYRTLEAAGVNVVQVKPWIPSGLAATNHDDLCLSPSRTRRHVRGHHRRAVRRAGGQEPRAHRVVLPTGPAARLHGEGLRRRSRRSTRKPAATPSSATSPTSTSAARCRRTAGSRRACNAAASCTRGSWTTTACRRARPGSTGATRPRS